MPTLYKAQLVEKSSYETDAIYIREWLSEHDRDVLGILRFYDEHGKLGDFEGDSTSKSSRPLMISLRKFQVF